MAAQTDGKSGRGFSWLVAALLLSSLFINYIDRQAISVLAPFLPPELQMDSVTFGRITSLFLLAYGLAMPLAGWFVDRLGTRSGVAVTVAFWSLIELLHGTARSVSSLETYRFLLGIPEAAGLPAVTKVSAEHAAPHARAALIGIAMFGLGMGTTFAPPVVAFLTLHFGWSWAFYGTGLLGFVWVLIWLAFYRPNREVAAVSRTVEKPSIPWVSLLRDKQVIGLTVSRAFSDSIWWFYLFWIPPFLHQERGLDLHHIGILGWIPYFFASIGSVFGGFASGYLIRRRGWEPVRARKAILWLSASIVPFTCLVVTKAPSTPAVLGILATATFFIQAYFANVFSLPADIFPHERVASVVGLNVMAGTLAGSLAVQTVGIVVHQFSYTPVFLAMAFFLPAGAFLTQVLVDSSNGRVLVPQLDS